jgi:hypothetical protein
MFPSSVKTYPLGPSFVDLTKVLISLMSSTYVMIIFPFLKYEQRSIAEG